MNEMTGDVSSDGFSVIANLDMNDGQTVRSMRYGSPIAYLDEDGTIRVDRYGQILGFVESDGTVHSGYQQGPVVGRVSPPHIRLKGALLLIL